MQGRIKMFDTDKGYGFILGKDGNDYFAHISNINSAENIQVGLFVTFELNENEKGKYAEKILEITSIYDKDELLNMSIEEIEEIFEELTDTASLFPNGRDFDAEDEDFF